MSTHLAPSRSARPPAVPAPRQLRRRAPDRKREQIAQAAAELFAERGYSGATTAAIAARAGVSEGTVFHHYTSKRGLFRAVVARYGAALVRAMFGVDTAEPPSRPRDAIRAGFAYVRGHAALHRVFATREADLAELVYAGTYDPIVTALERTLSAGVERGVVRPMNTRIVAELCYSLVDGALRACFIDGDGQNEDAYLREAIDCVERALAPHAPE